MPKQPWWGHYIQRNHGCSRPQNYVFVDVETKQEQVTGTRNYTRHTLQLGVACSVIWNKGRQPIEQWFDFEHASHFWQWLKKWQKKKRVLWVIAHNAHFDLTILGLWKLMEQGTYASRSPGKAYTDSRTGEQRIAADWIGMLAIEGTPFHVETIGPKGRVNFSDLQNYYQCSLRQVGNTVGIDKGNWDSVRDSEAELRAYCHSDVEILKRGYLGLVEQWEREDNGNWQFSAASLAYSHFRHRYMDTQLAVHRHANALDLEWESLYGGEVRCWFRGRSPGSVLHFDVNSLYPSVMQDQVYPTALVDYIPQPNRNLFRKMAEQYACVAKVDLATGSGHYPLRHKGKICYPIGKFTTVLAGPELLSALEAGHIVGCTAMAVYTYAAIFKRYTLEWWNAKSVAKAKGDLATERFAKLMLNSLPAKFAQRTPSWENEPRVDVVQPWKVFPWKDPKTGTIYTARSVGWQGQVSRHRIATEHAFPLIYAYVTAYARQKMREMRKHIPPSLLFYQDTDSLMVDTEAYESGSMADLPIGDGLGQLRLTGQYGQVIFRGLKNYTADDRHVISGVRRSDVQVADMKWSAERFERVSALFMRPVDDTIRTHIVDIDTPGCDSEGGYMPNGWVKPIILPPELDPYILRNLTQSAAVPDFST